METSRAISKTLATVALSSLLGFLAARISGIYEGMYDIYIAVSLLAILFTFATYLFFFERIQERLWSSGKRKSLMKPVFAIIKQEDCPRGATRFTPEDWRQRLEELCREREFGVEIVEPRQISSKYTVVINPYGEYYPETDLAELRTLQRIRQYISEGGTFVHAGGIAFYHGRDNVRKREAPLAREFEGYRESQTPSGARVLVPTRLWPEVYAFSLVETPLADLFKVQTTVGDPRMLRIYQEDQDRKYVGDLSSVGGTEFVKEFSCC